MRITNKSVLLDELAIGIREAFNRSEVFLDLDICEDPLLKQEGMMQKRF